MAPKLRNFLNATNIVNTKSETKKVDVTLPILPTNNRRKTLKVVKHYAYSDAFTNRKLLNFNPSKKEKTANFHEKYVYLMYYKNGDMKSVVESEASEEEGKAILQYKATKRLAHKKLLIEGTFDWNEDLETGCSPVGSPGLLNKTAGKSREKKQPKPKEKVLGRRRKLESIETPPIKKRNISDNESETEDQKPLSFGEQIDVGRICVQHLKFVGHLGEGAQAKVYEARDSRNGKAYAVKVFTKSNKLQEILDETVILQSVKHSNIIRLEEQAVLNGETIHVLEKGDETLYDQLHNGVKFDMEMSSRLFGGMVEALVYLHSKFGMHRDVKPENILRVGDVYKLTDFGIFCKRKSSTDKVGTNLYMAPEIDGADEYTSKVDIFALGVVAVEVFTGQLLSDGDDIFSIRETITNKILLDFVSLLTDHDPLYRPTALGLKHHPLITMENPNKKWRMTTIKLQLKNRLKDTTIAYIETETVDQVENRVRNIFGLTKMKDMRFVITERKNKETKLRDGELCNQDDVFQLASAGFNIKMVFQMISGVDDIEEKAAVRVKYGSWGTIPKLIFLVDSIRVNAIMEQLFIDFGIPETERESFDLFVIERMPNGAFARTKLLPNFKCVTANVSKNKYLILEQKSTVLKQNFEVTNETIL